jgi:PPM family protein phosphatase
MASDPGQALTLHVAARSDRGLVRGRNQDCVHAGRRLLAVADGMGGAAAGDVASQKVIGSLKALDGEDGTGDLMAALRAAVDAGNEEIRAVVEADPALSGMGTTLTAMLFAGSRLGLAHIGDSRAYRLREGTFRQLTKDDTYVQMLVDRGAISAQEAAGHPQRSVVTRVLQGKPVEPAYSVHQVQAGDRYLICSDGLSAVVDAETIEATLREHADPRNCAETLLRLALRGGGPDNVTVVVADAVTKPPRRVSPRVVVLLLVLAALAALAAGLWFAGAFG